MAVDTSRVSQWIGRTACAPDGGKIGRIEDVYVDEQTRKPEWLAVATGLFGSRVSFVPITGANESGGDVVLQFTKDQVKDAPNADADGALSQDEEARLYQHYGLDYNDSRSDSGLPDSGYTETAGRQGRTTGKTSRDDAMTRSEEELRVNKTTQEKGRVRLRKWVETERVEQTVPVTRETVRVEREDINSGNIDEAMSGPEISEAEHEVVLNEEVVSADKQTVPKERIRLDKERVTEQEQIAADLRKERVEVEGDTTAGRRGKR